MHIETVTSYRLHVPSGNPFDPVIIEGDKELLVCAYAVASAYLSNGEPRVVSAIKAVRTLIKGSTGTMWGLRETRLFVEAVRDDKYFIMREDITSLFYVPREN